MRFRRHQRSEFQETSRKRAALLRKQKKEREALPLFADQIAAEQPSVETVMGERRERWASQEVKQRQSRAIKWREGRAKLHQYPAAQRRRLLDFWNRHRWFPADPVYLLEMLNMYDGGRLDLDAPGVLVER